MFTSALFLFIMSLSLLREVIMTTELFEFKYAPKTMDDMIVSPDLREKLTKAIKELPNMILIGPPGTGKGTFVDILRRETGIDCLKINCSDETGIDNIREKVKDFATSVGFGGIKLVYLNEADFLSMSAQAMLRDLMESVQSVTRFVLCGNYGYKIIPELYDRCQLFELTNPPAKDTVQRCWSILDKEGIKYDKKLVVDMVKDIWSKGASVRRCLVTLRQNITNGVLSSNITLSSFDKVYDDILQSMKSGDPDKVRTLLKSNQVDYVALYKHLYEALMGGDDVFKKDAQAILHVGEHLHRDGVSSIKEVNFMHMYFKMLSDGTV